MIRGHGSPIAQKGQALIAALILCGSLSKASAQVGISVDAAKHWLSDEDFRAEYEAAKRVVVEEAYQFLRGAMWESVAVLVRLRDDPEQPATLRRQCAYDILTLAKTVVDGEGLSERLAQVAAQVEMLKREFVL
jgi:hypothetical protein